MRFVTPNLIDGLHRAHAVFVANAVADPADIKAEHVGTDDETITMTMTGGATLTFRNQLPVVEGRGYSVVMTFTPAPESGD